MGKEPATQPTVPEKLPEAVDADVAFEILVLLGTVDDVQFQQ